MEGKITFTSLEELAEFLAAFTGKSTAVFNVEPSRDALGGRLWILKFNGGY